MRQSSHLLSALPACVVIVALLCGGTAARLEAQSRYRVMRTENFRREPTGTAPLLATVNAGVEMRAESVDGRWVQVVLEGWIWARSMEETNREGYDLIVAARDGENVRNEPNGRILARASSGALFAEAERRPGWVRVRRVGWMFGPSLEQLGGAPAAQRRADPPRAAPVGAPPAEPVLDRAVTADRTALHRAPGGDSAGVLSPDAPVRIIARSGEWVRVQFEAWARETDLRPSTPGVLVGVTGAEVRARPAEFQGKLVQWIVQFIAVQDADEVRRDIPTGQRYMLARGPLPETGFVYVVLTDEQVGQLAKMEPLTELIIVGQVRTGRSHYLGNPILSLVEMARRRDK